MTESTKKDCAKGCCGSKKRPLDDPVVPTAKKPCAKGCCGSKKTATSEPAKTKKPCASGCCGSKKKAPEPVKTKKACGSACGDAACGSKNETSITIGADEFTPLLGGNGCTKYTEEEKQKWRFRAYILAAITIVWNMAEAGVAIGYGVKSATLTLVTFGGGSLIEVVSAAVVIFRLAREDQARKTGQKLQVLKLEKACAILISTMLVVLAILAATGATYRLYMHETPETGVPGLIISLICLVIMYIMYHYKVQAAKTLQSITLEKEAYCSLGCIRENFVVLLGSVIFILSNNVFHTDKLWWVDSACTYFIAFLVIRYGIKSFIFVCSKDFDGTCSCCTTHQPSLKNHLQEEDICASKLPELTLKSYPSAEDLFTAA